MWQLTWIFNLLPDFLVALLTWLLILGGVGALAVSKINSLYKLPLEIGGVVALVLGVYMQGGRANEEAWKERVEQVQAQLKEAEVKSAQANTDLGNKAEEKVKYVKGRTEYITRYIDKEIVKYDTKFAPGGACEIPAEFVAAHNQAAEAPKK